MAGPLARSRRLAMSSGGASMPSGSHPAGQAWAGRRRVSRVRRKRAWRGVEAQQCRHSRHRAQTAEDCAAKWLFAAEQNQAPHTRARGQCERVTPLVFGKVVPQCHSLEIIGLFCGGVITVVPHLRHCSLSPAAQPQRLWRDTHVIASCARMRCAVLREGVARQARDFAGSSGCGGCGGSSAAASGVWLCLLGGCGAGCGGRLRFASAAVAARGGGASSAAVARALRFVVGSRAGDGWCLSVAVRRLRFVVGCASSSAVRARRLRRLAAALRRRLRRLAAGAITVDGGDLGGYLAAMSNADFAARLSARLAADGMSGRRLAVCVGVSPQAVVTWLSGSSMPSPATAAAIRSVLPGLDVPERRMGRPRCERGA